MVKYQVHSQKSNGKFPTSPWTDSRSKEERFMLLDFRLLWLVLVTQILILGFFQLGYYGLCEISGKKKTINREILEPIVLTQTNNSIRSNFGYNSSKPKSESISYYYFRHSLLRFGIKPWFGRNGCF